VVPFPNPSTSEPVLPLVPVRGVERFRSLLMLGLALRAVPVRGVGRFLNLSMSGLERRLVQVRGVALSRSL